MLSNCTDIFVLYSSQMENSQIKIIGYLKALGLSQDEADVFVYLNQHGDSTVLEISRGLGTGRTKLYPLLTNLAEKQLVHVHERHYGTSYEPVSLDALDFLVSDLENKAETLRKSLPAVNSILETMRAKSPSGTRTIEYKGIDGLKQMNFNLTKAEDEYRVFELAHLDEHRIMPRYFVEKFRQAQVDNKLTSFDLTNDKYWSVNTRVKNYQAFSKARYINPKIFKINFETYIYNNCVALLNYEQDDIFGIEIYNQNLANQQKQIFDLLWRMGKEIKASR